MQVAINPSLYDTAQIYAERQGINITMLIENFLERYIKSKEKVEDNKVPDIVLNLLGAGVPLADDDINGRDVYYKHLEEKYQ